MPAARQPAALDTDRGDAPFLPQLCGAVPLRRSAILAQLAARPRRTPAAPIADTISTAGRVAPPFVVRVEDLPAGPIGRGVYAGAVDCARERDTWNEGAGGGGEGNGYSYRPDPTKETRVYVPRFLCGTKKAAPPTIVIEGLPPFDAAGARPRLNRSLPPDAEADARPRLNRRVR